MAGRRKPAEDRKREVVETALRLLSTQSVESLTTERIAAEVGISQAAIFRHFPTKNALWLAVLAHVEVDAEALWQDALAPDAPPLERIQRLLGAQLALIATTPAVPKLIFTVGRMTTQNEIREIHLRIMTRLRALLIEEASAAARENDLRTDLRATDIADLFLGLIQGAVLRWQLSDRKFDLAREGTRLIDCQLRLLTQTQTQPLTQTQTQPLTEQGHDTP